MLLKESKALRLVDLRDEAIFYAVTEGNFIKPRSESGLLDDFVASVYHLSKYVEEFLRFYESCTPLIKWAEEVSKFPDCVIPTPVYLNKQDMSFDMQILESECCLSGCNAIVFRRFAKLLMEKYKKTRKPYRYEKSIKWYLNFINWMNTYKHIMLARDKTKMKMEFSPLRTINKKFVTPARYIYMCNISKESDSGTAIKKILAGINNRKNDKCISDDIIDFILEPGVQQISKIASGYECVIFYQQSKSVYFEAFIAFDTLFLYSVKKTGHNYRYYNITLKPLNLKNLDSQNRCITKQVILSMYEYVQKHGTQSGEMYLPGEVVYG